MTKVSSMEGAESSWDPLIVAPKSRKLCPVQTSQPNCRQCASYYVTYESAWPHGCRAFEIKSRQLPSVVVLESSGAPCQSFAQRATLEKKGPPRG